MSKAKQMVEANKLKAKAHNEKVLSTVERMSYELNLAKEINQKSLQEKLESAASRREEKIELVKQAAAQSALLSGSSPKK